MCLWIAPDGSVSRAEPAESSQAHRSLVNAATRSVLEWKFEPEQVDGQPVEGSTLTSVGFCILPRSSACFPTETAASDVLAADGDSIVMQTAMVVRLLTEVNGRVLRGD
ncbi:energy transducer TonB [Pseudofulvimonas gallinarii]|uniref:TonB-like protein n=1 Tax=Pseudofulvimonas gallinarii TaxID=634155 RepID=A0A4R3L977_9GAMM|nr:energy transducer TonB [Pseudofulvimonas gallinarii]TCS96162.1 TonB-like protein [Pseudofulvimonas gallinarii]